MNRSSLNLGDSPSRCSSGTVGFFKWSTVARKPRYSEQMESGVLYFMTPGKAEKNMRSRVGICMIGKECSANLGIKL